MKIDDHNYRPLEDTMIVSVIDHFYARLRRDPMLGPVFDGALADWDEQLQKLASFWSPVMTRNGRHKGNPVAAHLRQKDAIIPAMFDRWLSLWTEVAFELLPDEAARPMQPRAVIIAESGKLALFFRLPGGAAATGQT